MPTDASVTSLPPPVGRGFARVDGPLKVAGVARYSSDHHFPGMLYAVPVAATVAHGRVAAIDTAAATAMPGVRKVYTRENIGRFYRVARSSGVNIDERRPPFEDDAIAYYGQYVALVVADTFEQATAAARRVKVDYADVHAPDIDTRPDTGGPSQKVDTERGDAAAAFASAPVRIDQTYSTPEETHNPIELHASVAVWDGRRFTLYETTQSIMNHRAALAQMLGVPTENVQIVTAFLGSGFGGKLWPWPHSLLAAAAARDLQRPVKLVVTREQMFHNVGHRPLTRQRMRLGATRDGKLVSLRQDYTFHQAREGSYKENCGEATGFLYSTPNLRVAWAPSPRDLAPATAMRGPGAVPGLFAVESAMDELAVALGMDPVQLRLRNEPAIDESLGIPFSSRHLKECLATGAEKFGWSRRTPAVGSMRDGAGRVLGWGVAACSWMAERLPAEVSLMLHADGSVRVASGTQDIGTGTYTVLAQMAAQLTGVEVSKVKVVIGDTDLPPGPLSGGSMVTGSMVPALVDATQKLGEHLIAAATENGGPFARVGPGRLAFTEGRVHRKGQPPAGGRRFEDVLAAARLGHVEGRGKSEGTLGAKKKKFSTHSYGAHFVEVTWQPEIARLRVSRVVSTIDAGRIVNPLTGRNQIEGAIVMGVGMAMLEETFHDPHDGKALNSNLADYMMATHADAPAIDVHFLDYPDTRLNALGVRGIGEIGLAGVAAAIASATYHATGVRVRDLPIRIEDLLSSRVA
jgi:xanthine dehydrogenase YagR molybdenum-binding subunit